MSKMKNNSTCITSVRKTMCLRQIGEHQINTVFKLNNNFEFKIKYFKWLSDKEVLSTT